MFLCTRQFLAARRFSKKINSVTKTSKILKPILSATCGQQPVSELRWFSVGWTFVFHEESSILAEKTQSAGIANSLTGDTLPEIAEKSTTLMILREMTFYFLTLMLVISSITFVVPNLSYNLKNYDEINKIIDSTRVIERKYEDKYGKQIEKTFAITATDGYEIYVSKSNLKNWDSLVNNNFKSKKLNVILRNSNNGNLNPLQIKIDNKIVLSKNKSLFYNYLLLALTIFCLLYSFNLVKVRLKSK